jgi:hypothetical protein
MSAQSSHRNAELKKVEQTLRAASPNGARTALLVLGNGVHLQAAREAGLDDPDPWLAAIRLLARQSGIRDIAGLPAQEPLRWDALVRQASAALHRRSPRGEDGMPLFGRLLDLQFENILSFNIDRTLALHSNAKTFVEDDSWNARLRRHDIVTHHDGLVTRIWYPYGDTCVASEMIVGTEMFASQLMAFEDERGPMMNDWVEYRVETYSYPGARPHTKLKSPDRFYKQSRMDPRSWYRMFFAAPLVIIGASLPLEDWPLWWLLHQRARNLSVFRKAPPAYFLAAKGEARPHLYGRPAEIDIVEFPSHDALWKLVLWK